MQCTTDSYQYYKENSPDAASHSMNSNEFYPAQFDSNSYYYPSTHQYSYEYNDAYSLSKQGGEGRGSISHQNYHSNNKKKYRNSAQFKDNFSFEDGANPSWVDQTVALETGYGSQPHYNSQRQNYLSVDTSAPRSSQYSSYFTSPHREEFEKISPHRKTSHTSPGYSKSTAPKRNAVSPDGFVYQVQFKRAHKNFILAPSAPRDLLPGDFVKVEADRGEDMGIVLAKCPAEAFEEVIPTAGYRGRGFSSGQGERKYLFRRATPEERVALATKVADEEKALEYIREKAAERGLPMQILDAEYQFDRHKLTYFFEADRRIDFRELVSELFSLYKTRIWMQQVDTSTVSSHDAGIELAKATGFLPEREDIVSTRSSFTTSNEDPLSGGSISELNDPDATPAVDMFHSLRVKPRQSFEELPDQKPQTSAFGFADPWYSSTNFV